MNKLEKLLNEREIVFIDGATGTMLQKSGMPKGVSTNIMNIIMPHIVEEVHRQYVLAGSDIICTNTVGANTLSLEGTGYTPERIIAAGIELAKNAAGESALVAYDMTPIGELLEPSGELPFEKAYGLFKEQALLAGKYGADLVTLETMGDINELRLAISAVRENTSLPVIAMMTFMESGKTYMGATVSQLAELAEEHKVEAVGMNCSLPPSKMLGIAKELREATALPLIIKLNAGMPESDGSYAIAPDDFARQMLPYRELGVRIVGACCGSSPEFISELRRVFA